MTILKSNPSALNSLQIVVIPDDHNYRRGQRKNTNCATHNSCLIENGEIIRVEDIPELVSPKNPPTLKVINISFS